MTVAINGRIVILMGVSSSGKTSIGKLLARELGWRFYDGDEFHPKANLDKMRLGIALTDYDREPWLAALQNLIFNLTGQGRSAVITCSALKQVYRDRLVGNLENVVLVYLKGDYDLIERRLLARKGHFFNPDLLKSQFETLEEPKDVLTVDIAQGPSAIVDQIRRELGL